MSVKKYKNVMMVPLTDKEIEAKLDRLSHAESLIKQLRENHKGRNLWLRLYGKSAEAVRIRKQFKALKNDNSN